MKTALAVLCLLSSGLFSGSHAQLPDPVHRWALDETSGETATDTGAASDPAKVHLTLDGSAEFIGPPGYDVRLPNSASDKTSSLTFPGGVKLTGANGITVAAWVRFDSFAGNSGTILALDDCTGTATAHGNHFYLANVAGTDRAQLSISNSAARQKKTHVAQPPETRFSLW